MDEKRMIDSKNLISDELQSDGAFIEHANEWGQFH